MDNRVRRLFNVGIPFGLSIIVVIATALSESRASFELDRRFSLESVGFLKESDNLDGIFVDPVAALYKDYFSRQSRFIVSDLSKADAILTESRIPYSQVILDSAILRELARSSHTDSLIRTKVTKESSKFVFNLEWIHASQGQIVASHRFSIDEPRYGSALDENVLAPIFFENLDKLIAQVPFQGHVTGRDGNTATINMGSLSNIKKGDILQLGTIEEVKKHPLLRTVVDWKIVPTGKIQIEQVEEKLAFGKIIEESPKTSIQRYQKITQIQQPSLNTNAQNQELAEEERSDPSKGLIRDLERLGPPILGWVGVSLGVGSYSRQLNALSGSAMTLGGRTDSEIWLTRNWFADMEIGYSFWNFAQQDNTTGSLTAVSQNGSVMSSVFSYKFNVGYAFLPQGTVLGPKGWLKLGYKSNSFSMPVNTTTESTGPISFGSIFIGVGGYVPLYRTWGATLNFNYRLMTSVNQTGLSSGTVNSTNDIEFYVGGYYHLSPRLSLRAGLEIFATGADFSTGENLSQKSMTFVPSLLYYF